MDLENTVWIDQKTGLPVDFQCPITQDLLLTPQIPEESAAGDTPVENSPAVNVEAALQGASDAGAHKEYRVLAFFLVILLVLLVIDFTHRHKERRNEAFENQSGTSARVQDSG